MIHSSHGVEAVSPSSTIDDHCHRGTLFEGMWPVFYDRSLGDLRANCTVFQKNQRHIKNSNPE
jgi:hypothetical protein